MHTKETIEETVNDAIELVYENTYSFASHIGKTPKSFIHLRGPQRMSCAEYAEASMKACMGSNLKPLPCFGVWNLPYEASSRNFVVAGLQGTGKSTIINMLMNSVLPDYIGKPGYSHRALIHDHKGESIPLMAGMGFRFENQFLKTLNPFDQRSVYWDLAKDFDNDIYADILAEILIPHNPNSPQPEFPDAAREIVSGCVKGLNDVAFHQWKFHHLIRLCATASRDTLIGHLRSRSENTPSVEILTSDATQTRDGVMFTLRSHLSKFKSIAALWAKKTEGITVSHFLDNSYVLLLGSFSSAEEAVQKVNQLFVTRLLEAFLCESTIHTSDRENPNRTWLFLDEGPKVGHLKKLPDALDLGRQMGLSVVFAFHDIPQVKSVYEDLTYSLLAKFHNRFVLKLGDDESKEWASNLFGIAEVLDLVPNVNYSTGGRTLRGQSLITGVGNENICHSINVTTRERKLVLPSEFGALPLVTESTGIVGFLSTVVGQTKAGMHWKGINQRTPIPDNSVLGRDLVNLQEIHFS